MHDVISDILASDVVPRDRKRGEILKALAQYRDDTTEVVSREEWLGMAQGMGSRTRVVLSLVCSRFHRSLRSKSAQSCVTMPGGGHAGHRMPATRWRALRTAFPRAPDDAAAKERLVNALFVLLSDDSIQQRVASDSALRRALIDLMPVIPEGAPRSLPHVASRAASSPASRPEDRM
jgi:hypothetical protein